MDNVYNKQESQLALPKRIMKFLSERSIVKKMGQGHITTGCPDLWEMTKEEFETIFGVKVDEDW